MSKNPYLFINEKTFSEIESKLDFILSKWDDDHIMGIYEKNWKCLCCNKSFQGINANIALANILGNKGMHIISFYVPKEKTDIKIYQELQQYKQAQKGVLREYLENIKASIRSLQNKSSSAIESTIHGSSKIITS